MPDSAGSFLLPEVRYPYYDLAAGEYRTATAAPRALAVAPGIEPHAARALPPLARGRVPAWADELARDFVPWGWLVLFVGPPLLVWLGRRRAAGARVGGTAPRAPRDRGRQRGRRPREAPARPPPRLPLRAPRSRGCGRARGGARAGAARAERRAGWEGAPRGRRDAARGRRGARSVRPGPDTECGSAVRCGGAPSRGRLVRGTRGRGPARAGALVQPRGHPVPGRRGRQGDGGLGTGRSARPARPTRATGARAPPGSRRRERSAVDHGTRHARGMGARRGTLLGRRVDCGGCAAPPRGRSRVLRPRRCGGGARGPRGGEPGPAAGDRPQRRHAGSGGAVRRCEPRIDGRGRCRAAGRAALRRLARGAPRGRRPRLGARRRSIAAVRATIAVLAPQVADQIAAGEVVERPASVLKELIENALDAGATAIRVEIEDGGKSLIRVSDDGAGMSRADAELALSRHATSKIREAADLIGVATFGFRGEALPAIASVSRFELETSPDGRTGCRLRVVGGKVEGVEDAVRQRGTTVTVRGLFFNTPARRKFLRAQATETRAAVEVVTLLALTRPDVAFTLTSDDRSLIDVRPTTRPIDRVHALWGPALADTLLQIAHREGPLEVRGFAQRPAQAKPAGRKGYV